MESLNLATRGYVDAQDEAISSSAAQQAATQLLDMIYPVGSIVLGTHPTVGTWEPYDFGGVIYSDASLADGVTMTEALPNITGNVNFHGSGSCTVLQQSSGSLPAYNRRSAYRGGGDTSGATSYDGFHLDASKSSTVYGATTQTGYNIQVKGKNTTAWIRTA